MITRQAGRVIQAGLYIGACQLWILLQHIFDGIAGCEEFQDCLNGNAGAANYGLTVANVWLD